MSPLVRRTASRVRPTPPPTPWPTTWPAPSPKSKGRWKATPRSAAGAIVSLSNVGEPIDGKYVLTSTCHRLDTRGYETAFVISGQQDRSLLGLVAGGVGGVEDRRFPGVMPAIVSNVTDPNDQGRVKVKLPWMDESYESDWARMVQAGAGRPRGGIPPRSR